MMEFPVSSHHMSAAGEVEIKPITYNDILALLESQFPPSLRGHNLTRVSLEIDLYGGAWSTQFNFHAEDDPHNPINENDDDDDDEDDDEDDHDTDMDPWRDKPAYLEN